MLPTLQLLDTYRQWLATDSDGELATKSLERLLISYVILPFRGSTIASEQHSALKKEVLLPSLADDMTLAIKQHRFPPPEQFSTSSPTYAGKRSSDKTKDHLTVAFLLVLFDVALSCRPRHLPQLRRREDPWLIALFGQLTKCLEQRRSHGSKLRLEQKYARLVKWLLRKARDHGLRLLPAMIETILEESSGLFSGKKKNVEWEIISLCLSNDSNVFIIPAHSIILGQDPPHRPPNRFLSALLSKITELGPLSPSNTDVNYALSNVLVPLGRAFSEGRDLKGFFTLWREQLNALQLKNLERSFTSTGPTLWEDQKLLESIAKLVESTLTPGQIDQLLSVAAHDLESLVPNTVKGKSTSLSSLVILDCLFEGITHDSTKLHLATTAHSVSTSIEAILSSENPGLDRWRMWRIVGTIIDRWFPTYNTRAFEKTACLAVSRATRMINNTVFTSLQLVNADLTEILHAFKYIIRFIAEDDSFWKHPKSLSRQHILLSVRKAMDAMEPFCHRTRQDLFGTIKSPDSFLKWEEYYGSRIVSPETFYIGCIGYMISSPRIIM